MVIQPTTEEKHIASVGYHYYPSSVCKIITTATQSVSGYTFPPTGSGCIRDVYYCYHIPLTDFVLKRQVDICFCTWPS